MTRFKIGQRVRCVAEFTAPRKLKEMKPIVGMVYRVRETLTQDGETGIYLEEIVNPKRKYRGGYNEPAFTEDNFILEQYPSAMPDIISGFAVTKEAIDAPVRKNTNRENGQ